jgi:hypothetical protein
LLIQVKERRGTRINSSFTAARRQDQRASRALNAPRRGNEVMEAHMSGDIRKSIPPSALDFVPGFGDLGRKQMEAAMEVQKEFLDMGREWIARMQSEVTLVSELMNKLATARSGADATTACQECATRQLEMFAEDSRRVIENSEKLARAGARLFADRGTGLSS